jgi:hypothetical protein
MVSCLLFSTQLRADAAYTEDFSPSPTTWDITNGAWSASTGELSNSTASPAALGWYKNRSWTSNFTYTVSAYADLPDPGKKVGVVFGLTDATHYFSAQVDMAGTITLAHSGTTLTTATFSPASAGLLPDTWFKLQLFVTGSATSSSVTVKINDKKVLSGFAITPVAGMVGVITSANLARFDDVDVDWRMFRGTFSDTAGNKLIVDTTPFQTPPSDTGLQNCSNGKPTDERREWNCYANLTGLDASGDHWPISLWGDNGVFQLLTQNTNVSVTNPADPNYITRIVDAHIEHLPGHVQNPDGSFKLSDVLVQEQKYMQVTSNVPQVPYIIRPDASIPQHDLYMRFWLNFASGTQAWWTMPWQFKTKDDGTDPNNNPHRVSLFADNSTTHGCTDSAWHWRIQGDDGHGDDNVFWRHCKPASAAPVPQQTWFKVEVFVHRASNTANSRLWVAIDGHEIFDVNEDAGMDSAQPIDRLMLPQMYGGDVFPAVPDNRKQYVDDLEIWNGMPGDASDDLPPP